jgi:hypothetical protein
MTVDFPTDFVNHFLGIPEDMRREALEQLMNQSERAALASTTDVEHEMDEHLPTDRLSWIQRRNTDLSHLPVDEHTKFANRLASHMMTGHSPSNTDTDFLTFRNLFDRLRAKHGQDSAEELLQSTSKMLASTLEEIDGRYIANPSVNGVAFGSIQSGKSTSMTGLTSAYVDAGGKVVVLLAGLTDDLRNQTQSRFEKDLLHDNPRLFSPTTISDLSTYRPGNDKSENLWYQTRANCLRHLRGEGNALVIITKKNKDTLAATHTLLDYLKQHHLLGDQPILVMDDECDYASLNTRSELFDGITNLNASRIHELTVGIRTGFPVVFWGFTASPQAHVLQHPQDPLAPNCLHVLNPHKHYLGPLDVFHDYRHLLVDPHIVNDVVLPSRGADAVQALKNMNRPPKSLIDAVLNYSVSGAIHHLQPRKFMPHGMRHSMMVHVVREIQGQKEMHRLVKIALRTSIKMLVKALETEVNEVNSCIAQFRAKRIDLRPQAERLPSKKIILEEAIRVLDTTGLRLLNSRSDDDLDYDDPEMPENLIVVGSQIIGRGLSIEGLRVSYFLRHPNTPVIDSTLQTARWFGPLKDDKDLICIHLLPELVERFAKIAMSDAQLRDEFRNITEQGLTVAEAQISHHPGYLATRKRRNGETMRRVDHRISIKSPWIGTTGDAAAALKASFDALISAPQQDLRGSNNALQGKMFTTTLDELEVFVLAQVRSLNAEGDFKDALERIHTLREVSSSPFHHIVLRNGSSKNPISESIPNWLQSDELHRVTRGSRDGRTVDQVPSGRTPNQTLYTSDWWVDGHRPSTPTAYQRGWRATQDPVQLVIYVIDKHNQEDRQLDGDGPWICFTFHFPHSGPGGSLAVNKHRRSREEE